MTTVTEWAKQYHECQRRHNGLVDVINKGELKR